MAVVTGVPTVTGQPPMSLLLTYDEPYEDPSTGTLSAPSYKANYNWTSGKWESAPGVELVIPLPGPSTPGANAPRAGLTIVLTVASGPSEGSVTLRKRQEANADGQLSLYEPQETLAFVPTASTQAILADAEVVATLKPEVVAAKAAAEVAASEALLAANVRRYATDAERNADVAPNGTWGMTTTATGTVYHRREGGAWVARGTQLLGRGATKEVLSSWYPTIQDALASGAGTIWLDDLKTATTTLYIQGVRLLDRGGTLEFPSGAPDSTGCAVALLDGAELGDNLKIRVTGGSYTRGMQPRGNNVTVGDADLVMSNTITATNVNSFGFLFSHLTPLLGLRVRNPRAKMINHARPMVFSISNCPGAVMGVLTAYDTVATSPNKLDWGCYAAQNCDYLQIAGIIVRNCNIGGFHSNDGASISVGKNIGFIVIQGVLFIGVALETYRSFSIGRIHVDGAGLPMGLGYAGGVDTGATLGSIYLANVGTPLGLDAEMLAVNGSNMTLTVTFGPPGNAQKGALINGANSHVTAVFADADRPVMAAQINTTAVGSSFTSDIPDVPVAKQTTTDPAVWLAAPRSRFHGSAVHTSTGANTPVIDVRPTAHDARIVTPYLDGTGRPVRIAAGAERVRVERPALSSRFSNATVLDSGTNSFIDIPQTTAALGGPIIARGRFNINTTVAAGAWYAQAVAVDGILVTDLAVCSPQGDPGTLVWEAVVWTDGQIRIRLYNPTASGVAVNRNFHYAIIRP